MDTSFYISLHIRTVSGFETFGKFFLGKDKEFAYQLFDKLKGQTDVDERSILSVEMMEVNDGLPQNLKMLTCTLDELAENTRIITKEVFKAFNLNE